MPGSEPGVPAAAVVAADGTLTYVNPATSPAYTDLPAGSAGALMLQGPQAPPVAPAMVRQVFTPAPVPGQPGKLVRLPGGLMSVTPSGLVAPPIVLPKPSPPQLLSYNDPPLIQTAPDGAIVVYPMNYPPIWGSGYPDPSGAPWDDSNQINSALLRLTPPGQIGPSVVRLVSGGVFSIYNTVGGAYWQYGTWIDGMGATLNWLGGAAPCVDLEGLLVGGTYPQNYLAGGADRLNIVNVTTGTIGLQYGAGSGFRFRRLRITNFGTYGVYEVNNSGWTEKAHLEASLYYNGGTGGFQMAIDSPTTNNDSHEYNHWEVEIHAQRGQGGLALLNNAWTSGSELRLYGNMQEKGPTAPLQMAALDLSGMAAANNSGMTNTNVRVELETTNSGSYNWQTVKFGANGVINPAWGVFRFTGGNWAVSDASGSQFNKFGGPIFGDSVLATANTTAPNGWP